METWENLLENYHKPMDYKDVLRILKVAEFILDKELVFFEQDYIFKTLFKEPILLVDLLKEKNSDPLWSKAISDWFKLLANTVMKFSLSDVYLKMLAELCSLPYDAQTNQQALHCLTCVVKKSEYGIDNISKYLYALELGTSCKAQLAVLVGTICEYHPERVTDDINTIWRVFLNLFDIGKYSTPVIKAVLQGIQSMLKHFGTDLPMIELNIFYDKFVLSFDIERCADICLSILGNYASLFRERLQDTRIHAQLWERIDNPTARLALKNVYGVMEIDKPEVIVKRLKKFGESDNSQQKLIALTILKDLQDIRQIDVGLEIGDYLDMAVLEFKMRNGTLTYDCCDAISWCVEAHVYNSERLVKVALVTYDVIPVGRKRQIIQSILKCTPERRQEIIEFLISETCNSPEKFMPIWNEILDDKVEADCTIEQRIWLNEFVNIVQTMLEDPSIDWTDPLSERITLLRLTWSVLTKSPNTSLAKPLLRCARLHCEAVPAAVLSCFGFKHQPDISVNCFTSDTPLINCGVALMQSSDISVFSSDDVLKHVQILFNYKKVAAETLISALKKLEYLLNHERKLDDEILDDIYRRIQKITNKKVDDKHERILRRDAIVFLGKYRRIMIDCIDQDVVPMTALKESLYLNVTEKNTHTKIDIHKILYKALVDENEKALRILMNVICQNLSIRKDSLLQSALYRVVTALSKFFIDIDTLEQYFTHCEPSSAFELVKYISQEKLPDSRENLLRGLEILLLNRDLNEEVLEELLEQVLLSESLNQIEADILIVILKAITDNNILIQKYIIQIINKGVKYNAHLTKIATEIFENRIGLFEKQTIDILILDLLKALKIFQYTDNLNIVTTVLMFIKILIKHTEVDQYKVTSDFIEKNEMNFYVLSQIKRVFNLSEEECEILYTENIIRINESLHDDNVLINLNEKLEFLMEFSDTSLLGDDTIDFIIKVIDNLTSEITIQVLENLEKCLKEIKSKRIPLDPVSKSISEWVKRQHIEVIANNYIEKYYVSNEEIEILNAIKVFCNIFDVDGVVEHKGLLMRTLGFIIKRLPTAYKKREIDVKNDKDDLVDVIMMVTDAEDLKTILTESSGISFCQEFMSSTYTHLTHKPYLLLDPQLSNAAALLKDTVKEAIRRNDVENILELVDQLWPIYLKVSTFDQRHAVLLYMSRSTVQLSSNSKPMQWLLQTLASPDTNTNERISLIEVIPPGEEYNSAYLSITSRLPTRLDEIKGSLSSYFRGILESFARTRNMKLLEFIMNLASSADTRGWWDDAMVVTVYAVSVLEDMSLCEDMYKRGWECALGGVTRLLVPLLRFSKASFCEEFFSSCLPHLLPVLEKKPRAATTHYTYQKYLHDTIKGFTLLEVLFQKVPRQSIESPKSHLYHKITDKVGDCLYWIVKTACKLGLTLKSVVKCPAEADQKMKDSYRLFHCAIYNCVVSALCCRDPSIDFYATVFDTKVWGELIGTEHLSLPIRYQWNRNSAHYTAPQRGRGASETLTRTLTRTRTRTELTRDFTHTLSENPLQFDLRETEVQAQEVPVGDSVLNRHECSPALISVLRKVAPHHPNRPVQLVAAALVDQIQCNAKWLLAQAICNCKEELKPHASVLRPALLDVTANTASNVFNSVHFDILETIILWHNEEELPVSSTQNLNLTIEHLINTILEYKSYAVVRSLLEKLEKLLDMYPNVVTVGGQFFKDRIVDFKSETTKRCIQILKKITKAKIQIPELLPTVFQAIEGKRVSPDVTELFGLALAITPNAEIQKRFRSMLEKTRRSDVAEYVKLLYYTQKGCPKCCDRTNFKVVSDLMPKIVSREKVKCVQIIVKCVSEGIGNVDNVPLHDVLAEDAGLELLVHSLPQIDESDRRQLVLQAVKLWDTPDKEKNIFKVILKAFELLISEPSEPSSKRRAESSRVCSLLRCTNDYVTSIMSLVGKAVASEDVRVVQQYLSTDSNVRFCECFALAVYFPMKFGDNINMSRALGVVLSLYFNPNIPQTKQSTGNATYSRDNVTTPSSSLSLIFIPNAEIQDPNSKVFQPKTPEEVLDELLKYALESPPVAAVICTQLIRAHRSTKRPGFDFDETMYDMLSQLVQQASDVTPYVMEMMMTLRHWEPSLKRTVDRLSKLTIDSEAEDLCKLFKEDFQIHTLGPSHLVMGFPYEDDVIMSGAAHFSIEDLVSTFDKLSNWEDLPIQEKNIVRASLPQLCLDVNTFKEELKYYDGCVNGASWFDKMADVYKGRDVDHMSFRIYDKWPRKMFDVSSVVELFDWERLKEEMEEEIYEQPVFIHPSECIAKLAARLMIRHVYLREVHRGVAPRDLLALCEHTNRSGLFQLTQTILATRFLDDSKEEEMLKLFELDIDAHRGLAAERGDCEYLEKAFIKLEQLNHELVKQTDPGIMLRIRHQALLVNRDRKTLSKSDVESVISQCLDKTKHGKLISKSNSDVLSSICILTVTYFNNTWDETDASEKDDLMKSMCDSLSLYLNQNLGDKWKLILDMIICRLDDFNSNISMSEETAARFLDQIKLAPDLDEFSKDHVVSNIAAFPSHLRNELSELQGDSAMMTKSKKCFQLVADVEHLLKDYCRWLGDALRNNDNGLWDRTFSNMKEKIFENPYAGADYQVLYKYKKVLYDMEEFDPQNEDNKSRLCGIERELRSDRSALLLPQLCPELCGAADLPCVAALLGLPRGLTVVKFDRKVTIFPGAVRRPALLTARTHDGGVRRVIVKSGERAATHAAAVRTLAAMSSLYPNTSVQTNYTVTALSDDCALIEYLENRVRLRDLIKSVHPIDDTLRTVQRAKNSELILSPQAALDSFNKICTNIPATVLRYAIESSSISVEDFIRKKKNFLESVSIMTIGTFVLGVGDRHLENMLWGAQGVCGVDWAALLQYGRAELPPARLTRTVLAACDLPALESRLQRLMSILRDNCQLLLPSVRVAFSWMGEEFEEKYTYMEGLVRGTSLSYHITQQALRRSDRPYSEKYVRLLDEVFADYPQRERYGVVEQVSSILRQSTDPRVLSVVRSEWEPWI